LCWRAAARAAARSPKFLREIGWRADRLDGGYKTYRRAVIADLETGPCEIQLACDLRTNRIRQKPAAACGPGRTARRCSTLKRWRHIVVRCWAICLMNHNRSPENVRSLIWAQLRKFDPAKPVFVEAESKRSAGCAFPKR
jgi:tRNA 2-selenouridine synthase